MAMFPTFIQSIGTAMVLKTFFTFLSTYIFYKTYIFPHFSPLRLIPGPPNKSKYNKFHIPFLGLFLDLMHNEPGELYHRWIEQYGPIVCYKSVFSSPLILLGDPKAIQHVFNTHAYDYPKPNHVIRFMSVMVGKGLLLVEGNVHRKQRKMLNPAFSHKHIEEMVSIMAAPAEQLCRIWESRVDSSKDNTAEFDVFPEISSCTLDIIGLAGFGYDFQSLIIPDNELRQAYRQLFEGVPFSTQLLRLYIPFYGDLPFKSNRIRKQSAQIIERVTTQIIKEKRARTAALGSEEKANDQTGTLDVGKLTDTELKAQIMTFMAAGHDTTSTMVTWILYIFSTHPEAQRRVRQEMLDHIGYPTETNPFPLCYDTLNGLPYLSACVKELLRLLPPVPNTLRVASQDDKILGYDIPKGTQILLSAAALHRLKSVYGHDAGEFKPERWMDPTLFSDEEKKGINFVTSEMTWAYIPFLLGPRTCIGSKFATIEAKILLYYLLMNLEYHPAPGFKFTKSHRVTMKPSPGMRLIVKRIVA
ncbi:hypothetical protein FBU30_003223 [Linnemannia zychae]|nr:hypothetical protein FBU30_003223 [Linnemannia zychae]